MAKNKKNKSTDSVDRGMFAARNPNASRDEEKTLRALQSSARKAGAQRLGPISANYGADTWSNRVTYSQAALIPVEGKTNTYTYGRVSATNVNQRALKDYTQTSVKAAKSQGGGERMNPKKKKK